VIKAAGVFVEHLPAGVHHDQRASGHHAADRADTHTGGLCRSEHLAVPLGWRRKEQFVVVAAMQQAAALYRVGQARQQRAARQRVELDLCPDAAAAHQVAQVTEQAVADIDGAAGNAAQALAQGLAGLQLIALPGPSDAAHADALPALAQDAGATLLQPHVAGAPHSAIAHAGGLTLGLLAITDEAPGTIGQRVAALRARGVDVIVALSTGSARSARQVATQVGEGIDFVVLGALDRAEVNPPERVANTALLSAGKHGHGLVVVDLFAKGAGPWTDASAWTREHQAASRAREIEALAARIERP